ncbi:MAG: complex I NDUFA9 subunit family protein [Burkholderiales bacterium]
MKKILILGGTGFVGRHVCEKIERLQWRATVPTRRLGNAQQVQMLPMVTPVEADVHDEARLARLVAGHDAVVNLVGVLHGDKAAFHKAHAEFPKKLAHACDAAGVRRIVHLSALGADANGPSMYQRSKAQGEAHLQLKSPSHDLTILRPSVMFGREDNFLNLFAKLNQRFPLIPLARAEARFQPVWVQDVAEAILRCVARADTIGKIYELCGPRVYTLRELVELSGKLSGHPSRVVAVSEKIGRMQASLFELIPGDPMMSRDNLDSMKTDNVASGHRPGLAELGIAAAELEAAVRGYFGPHSWANRLIDYRKTAGRY